MDDLNEDDSASNADNTDKDPDFTLNKANRKRKTRSLISDSWTEENIVKLISEVEIRSCLWNAGDQDYSNRNKRIAAFISI